jgi:hypothetical protein
MSYIVHFEALHYSSKKPENLGVFWFLAWQKSLFKKVYVGY